MTIQSILIITIPEEMSIICIRMILKLITIIIGYFGTTQPILGCLTAGHPSLCCRLLNPLTTVWRICLNENSPSNRNDFPRLAFTQQTHCSMHAPIFSHTQMTPGTGSLINVWRRAVDIEHARTYADLPIIPSSFEKVTVVNGLTFTGTRLFATSEWPSGRLTIIKVCVFYRYLEFQTASWLNS